MRLYPGAYPAPVQDHPGIAAVDGQVALGYPWQLAGERDGRWAGGREDGGVELDRIAGARNGHDLAECACPAVGGIGHGQRSGALCFGSCGVGAVCIEIALGLYDVVQRTGVARIDDDVERVRPDIARHEGYQPSEDAAGRHVRGWSICDHHGESYAPGVGEIDRVGQLSAGLHRIGIGLLGHHQPGLGSGLELIGAEIIANFLWTHVAVDVLVHTCVHAPVDSRRVRQQVITVGGEVRRAGVVVSGDDVAAVIRAVSVPQRGVERGCAFGGGRDSHCLAGQDGISQNDVATGKDMYPTTVAAGVVVKGSV